MKNQSTKKDQKPREYKCQLEGSKSISKPELLLILRMKINRTAVSGYFGEDAETAEREAEFEPSSFLFYQTRYVDVKRNTKAGTIHKVSGQ